MNGQHRRARQPLLERESELVALDHVLTELCGSAEDPVKARAGGLIAFAGPAGLGKTALIAEVRRRAAARGCTVLMARGGEHEQGVAFHVVRQLVQPIFAAADEAEHRRVLGSWYDIVAPAVGLVATAGGASPDPQGVRDGLDWVVTRFAVQQAPVVLILDDAHWADSESLAWLSAFVSRAEKLPMLAVVAYRPDELPLHATAFRRLAERQGSRPFDLAALTPRAVGRIVRELLGEAADDAFCRECWAVTGGNPFEVVELVAKIGERGLKPQQANVPELRDLASAVKGNGLIERLERLGSATVRLAYAAAVLGSQVSPSLAAGLAGLGRQEASDAADRLREARILGEGSSTDHTWEFFHPLVATAVYRAIPGALRVAMHGQAAMSVTDAGLGATAAARHLLEMHPDSDSWAVTQLRAAAEEYLRAGAPDAARRCLERALREPPAIQDRAGVLFELGRSSLLSEPATTVNHLRTALEEPELEPELREAITYRLAQALGHTDWMEEAARVVAQEAGRATVSRTRLRMQAEQFMWNAFRADEEDSPARSRLLTRLADHLKGRGTAERYILGLRAWDAMVRGESASTALHYAEEALGDGMPWTEENGAFEVPVLVALTFMYCDRPGRAEELFIKGIAECERKGWRGAHLSFGYTLLGYIRYRRGRLAEAEQLVHSGLQIADRVGQRVPAQWFAIGILIEILLARGRTQEARELADTYAYGEVVPNAVVYPDSETVYSELLLAQGLRQDAERHLTAVGRRLDPRGMRNPAWCPWQLRLAQALALSDPARAMENAQEAVQRVRHFGTPSAIGTALHTAAAVTPGAAGMKLLSEAVQQLERSPSAYTLATALVDHGAALRSVGLPQDAADRLYRGLEGAVHCGADTLAARARDELSAAGLRPLQLRITDNDALTGQERVVAELAGRGCSNPLIAEKLAIPERDVGRLLSVVYRKAGTDHAGLPRLFGAIPDGGGH
ncbi:helix-turn-helix transcriptional regulator [Streptomyces sp. H27-D2]|uniref:helix-turn-helix transcriptional regulator n=1 Tax=Streptomyces sp. H27-D2 TaxID=3046304 RepID=UPI002DBAB016|nr:AAA family ATPase [Streptomyces sp. H27-D2]MEC4018517.1 AAA family ATPase [Streptomyces sp. H27-D2]